MKILKTINSGIISLATLFCVNAVAMNINDIDTETISCAGEQSLTNSTYRKMKHELLDEGFAVSKSDLKRSGLTHFLVNKLPEFIQYKEITIPEFVVLYKYIEGLSYPLYTTLQSYYKYDLQYTSKVLCNTLTKMPNYRGVTFQNLNNLAGLSELSVGDVWRNNTFLDTNIIKNKHKVYVEIHSLTGKKIRKVTLDDDQFEYTRKNLVVFTPGTSFEIMDKKIRITNNYYEKEILYIIKEVKQSTALEVKLKKNTKPLLLAKGTEEATSIWGFGKSAFEKAQGSCELVKNDNDILSDCEVRCESKKTCSWAVSEWDKNYFESLIYREYQLDVYNQVE